MTAIELLERIYRESTPNVNIWSLPMGVAGVSGYHFSDNLMWEIEFYLSEYRKQEEAIKMEELLRLSGDLRETEAAIMEALDGVRAWLETAAICAREIAGGYDRVDGRKYGDAALVHDGQIEGMKLLADRLTAMQGDLKGIVPESIKERIEAEKAMQEELRDQWDAQSY